jgi:hypothetical protein
MFGAWISRRRWMVAAAFVCLAMGAMQSTAAYADSPVVLPPDRVDRIGVNTVSLAPRVQLSPDRADGLGSVRLPTMPTPVVFVRSVPSHSFEWLDAFIGSAVTAAFLLVVAAARIARPGDVAASGL